MILLSQTDTAIAAKALEHLRRVVAIDSASDESSDAIPSTPGQARLAAALEVFFRGLGARVERDEYANLIAWLGGRGALAQAPPQALMIHLDTARGTRAVDQLSVLERWGGEAVPYAANPGLLVDLPTYPSASAFLGHHLVHGPGDAPFGLDDKLGLAHLMTLAWLLRENPTLPHPPLALVARPDEEIGREGALLAVAERLVEAGVELGYTVDGIAPFEINVENFNASHGAVTFAHRPLALPEGQDLVFSIRGVNAHGATAKAEGHRAAPRLAAEVWSLLRARGVAGAVVTGFVSDPLRDCDARLRVRLASREAMGALERALRDVVGPHPPPGGGWGPGAAGGMGPPGGAAGDMLEFVAAFMADDPGWPLVAEASEGREGYSHPFRALPVEGGLRLDVRIRDFEPAGLAAREAHLARRAAPRPVAITHQYDNMGPRLAARPELVERARGGGGGHRRRRPPAAAAHPRRHRRRAFPRSRIGGRQPGLWLLRPREREGVHQPPAHGASRPLAGGARPDLSRGRASGRGQLVGVC